MRAAGLCCANLKRQFIRAIINMMAATAGNDYKVLQVKLLPFFM